MIDPGNRRNLADLDSANPLQRENLMRRVSVDHARNQNVRKSCQCSPESRSVTRFSAIVELIAQRGLQLLYHTDHVDSLAGGCMLGEISSELAEELYVVGKKLADVGPLDLDYDIASVAKLRCMYLPEACAAKR